MNVISTKVNYQQQSKTDAAISLLLQIPQGDRLEIQVNKSQYYFYLNETIVQQIQQAQQAGEALYIPPSVLIPLWYYTCISYNEVSDDEGKQSLPTEEFKSKDENFSQPITLQWLPQFYLSLFLNIGRFIFYPDFRQEISIQVAFTFNSYYKSESEQSTKIAEPILQSTIFLNGDIFHKIQKEFLETNSNCSTVISAHYWLTAQVLSYFRNNLNLLVWEIAAVVPAGFLAFNLVSQNLLSSLLVWLGATIGIVLSRPVVVKILQRVTNINAKNLNNWAWGLICSICSAISAGVQGMGNIYPLLMLFFSVLTPEIVKPILSYIWPHLGKLMGRLLSRLPF